MPLSPRKTLISKALAQSAGALVVVFSMLLGGCQSMGNGNGDLGRESDLAADLKREPEWLTPEVDAEEPNDIWERVRGGYQLQDEIGINPRIEQQRLWFVSNPSFVEKVGERSSPYIYYIVERLEERGMPMELALLPMIESAYNPFAYSPADAVGLWQFIPSTGRHFNLRQTSWYDGRRDVLASTNAAMNYLSRLHEMFNGDWLLALAAYNAGEGRVSRAIERNQQLGLPTDYWNLALPNETRNYVPKLLALSQVIMSPQAYGVSLGPIANEPYFEKVELKQRMDLSRVAAMADLDEDELYQLNPAFKRRITLDGPQHLLVPTDKAELLTANLAQVKPQELVDWQQYRVRRGDSLSAIANRYQLEVSTLKDLNRLTSNRLRIGQVLSIPAQPGTRVQEAPRAALASTAGTPRSYRVKSGDNLWQIAKTHQVSVKDVQRWNRLQGNNLRVGQTLILQASDASAGTSKGGTNATYYRVRKGDSLYLIAKRFKVQMKHLQRWNPRTGSALKPGQTLTLHLPR
ncbi:LysM peptidoglycan-binding domain-containing protein [Pseudomonas benzenivorans]|uniref:LysM peptidoglycan-binding domain-containing protein n=1 Tax=Pseudomonas benzenivorans TaxID=556533 RepID=A0ABZ0PRV8_9PSED|nr:LysM peptidoglycan-binding domain-containing protein [Pseudomonas benzenivorans]WPC03320.1 LysM peptidoglycan-binding domain-containing protein [Pseudomonas benzenivorans]